jgi:hypothetical protein
MNEMATMPIVRTVVAKPLSWLLATGTAAYETGLTWALEAGKDTFTSEVDTGGTESFIHPWGSLARDGAGFGLPLTAPQFGQ